MRYTMTSNVIGALATPLSSRAVTVMVSWWRCLDAAKVWDTENRELELTPRSTTCVVPSPHLIFSLWPSTAWSLTRPLRVICWKICPWSAVAVSVGTLSLTVNRTELEKPFAPSRTESRKCPSSDRNAAGMTAWSWLELTNVVTSGVKPSISTIDWLLKLLPLIVTVRSELPSIAEVWLRLLMCGATVWPDREKLLLKVAPPTMSWPTRSQSGARPGSKRIQLWRSVESGGKGVPGGAIGLAADSDRKSAPAGALSDRPTLGTKK